MINEINKKREISAQNTWSGHNSLRVHFGLGKTEKIEKVIIYWPSGNIDTHTNISVNQLLEIKENKKKYTLIKPNKIH